MSRRSPWNPALVGFECHACGRAVAVESVASEPTCSACRQPLVSRYDLERIAREASRTDLDRHGRDLWRWRTLLPLAEPEPALRLGEGGTPLVPIPRRARSLGLGELWLKDEASNPTQSFKARGLAVAVQAALVMGKRSLAVPSAGNAGSAAAAYAAAAGLRCRIAVPESTPEPFLIEQRALGAEVRVVRGTLADAGRALAEWAPAPEWWNLATFREPFRLEGKRTLGFEIAEQLGWRPPEAIFYPTGGGTGLVGMARAFRELAALGWIEGPAPRLVSVQAEGCAPIARAFASGASHAEPWRDAATMASGLCVPEPFADRLMLSVLRETGGQAVTVSEEGMRWGMRALARHAGCFACPEGGATLAALETLRARGEIASGARVVIFNTGSGLKYPEAWRSAVESAAKSGERAS